MTYQLEPRGEFEALVLEHFLQLLRCDISRVLCLVRIGFDVNIGLDEQDVVD